MRGASVVESRGSTAHPGKGTADQYPGRRGVFRWLRCIRHCPGRQSPERRVSVPFTEVATWADVAAQWRRRRPRSPDVGAVPCAEGLTVARERGCGVLTEEVRLSFASSTCFSPSTFPAGTRLQGALKEAALGRGRWLSHCPVDSRETVHETLVSPAERGLEELWLWGSSARSSSLKAIKIYLYKRMAQSIMHGPWDTPGHPWPQVDEPEEEQERRGRQEEAPPSALGEASGRCGEWRRREGSCG